MTWHFIREPENAHNHEPKGTLAWSTAFATDCIGSLVSIHVQFSEFLFKLSLSEDDAFLRFPFALPCMHLLLSSKSFLGPFDGPEGERKDDYEDEAPL